MLKDGEKGAVLQIDRETYAIAPHVPCGIVTPELLRKLADAAENYGAKLVKITSAYRIALYGIREEDVDKVWADLGMSEGHLTGLCVRSVRCCPGDTWCKLGQRDAIALGLRLDAAYHGMELVNKLKIAVSGCPIDCAEGWVRDVGLHPRGKSGWVLLAGGNVGSRPRLAREILRGLEQDDQAFRAVALVVEFYKNNAKRGERVGKMLERMGTEPLKEYVAKGLGMEEGKSKK
ncbi:MAG TPA: NAD(P)/FAD-dependent oxidoreductase [bacterium]|nr:NAD(P)/FAD-dependent oxidoreductase [bacterium]